jgi:multidrug resistance efflux pump
MEQADADLKRIAPDGPTTSEAQLDRAKATVKEATAQLEEARAKLSLLHSGSRSEDVSEAKFLRDAAKASVDEVSARLDRCSVRAPFSGTVVSTEVTLGQFVSAAAPQTLLELAGNDRPSVGDNVDQRDTTKNLHQTEGR